LPNAGNGWHDFAVQQKIRAQHTYDFELILSVSGSAAEAIQCDRFSDDVSIASETSTPETMAKDQNCRLAGLIFVWTK
jgi:hypothetical protein